METKNTSSVRLVGSITFTIQAGMREETTDVDALDEDNGTFVTIEDYISERSHKGATALPYNGVNDHDAE